VLLVLEVNLALEVQEIPLLLLELLFIILAAVAVAEPLFVLLVLVVAAVAVQELYQV
jgi:hypothetical protein